MSTTTIVYTDGACSGNPGPGGWAWVVPDGPYASGSEAATTNQRMELTAVLEAMRALSGPLEVVSDSTYVVNCFKQRWWEGWLARGWLNSQRKPVANRDLWEPIIAEYRARQISFRWVKGHDGDRWNDRADALAVEAVKQLTGGSRSAGSEAPAEPRSQGKGGDPALPTGHLIGVFGHRPPELGGYGETAVARRLRDRMTDILAAKHGLEPDLMVVSGMGLGSETLGAEAALAAGVPLVAVLAYPEFEAAWPAESRRRFDDVVSSAFERVTLSRKRPTDRRQAGAAQASRDAFLRRHLDEALVVWDGTAGTVGRLVDALQKDLGETEVWILDPSEV